MSIARLAIVALIVAACGGGDPTYPEPQTPNPPGTPGTPNNPGTPSGDQVTVQDNQFSPSSVTVKAGTTVTWSWSGGYSAHSVTFDGGPDSGQKTAGTYARSFSTPGVYTYQCTVHGSGMAGTVNVTP